MNYRDRILATLRGEPTDCLPFVPRLDLWYKANKKRGTLPVKYKNATLMDIVIDMNIGYHCVVSDFEDYIDPLDIVDRALGIYRLRTMPYTTKLRNVKRNIKYENDYTSVEYITPVGNIKTKVLFNETMRQAGITVTHIVEHAIKDVKDYGPVSYIFENIEIIPTYDKYLMLKEEIGKRGVVVARGSVGGSPMHYIEHELMPYDRFFYHFYDHFKELSKLANSINKYYQKLVKILSQSPAEIIHIGSNYDNQITWPSFFEKHITSFLSAAADTLHDKGKFLLSHTDGENNGLLSCYLASKIDIADSICPMPMTSLTLKEIREAFLKKITVWGGIAAVSVLNKSMNDYEFEKYIDKLFENIGKGDHLILSIADTLPPDANFSRIVQITKLAKEFGPVNP